MLATLTLPLCPDLPAPRTPTVRVRSADDLRGALRQARGSGLTVDASGMDRVLCFDAGRGLVEVQAATTWATLAAFLSTHDIDIGAFARDAALPTAIGECLALAAPGPDGQPATAHVAAITLATPDGELRRADRSVNAELFRLALGGQGVIGVLYSATLCLRSVQAGAAAAAPPVELGFGEAAGGSASGIECLLPPERLEAYLAAARALAEERRVRLHRIAVRRYLPESECHLRWARRDWAGVEVRFGVSPRWARASPRPRCAAACSRQRWRRAARSRCATCATRRAASSKPAIRRLPASSPRSAASIRPSACRTPGTGGSAPS